MKQSLRICLVVVPLALSGCGGLSEGFGPWRKPAPTVAEPVPAPDAVIAPAAPAGARTAAAFDRSSDAEKAAALQAPAGGRTLGTLTVSLGNPAEQGFWLRSALVSEKQAGVVKLASGNSAQVDLLPAGGGGPQLSLAAYRALGLGLTDLPSVTVLMR